MKKVGDLAWEARAYNTCEYNGKLYNFGQIKRQLVVSELFLDEEVTFKRVSTEVDCKSSHTRYSAACPFNDKVLVMSAERDATDIFCALVSIDPGELTKESIHVEEKHIIGWAKYTTAPFLVQISESKVWASLQDSDGIWIGELKGDELVMTKHPDHLPMRKGFVAVPLRLPDGRFLIAGGRPDLTDITVITVGERFSFEKIGNIPGEGRCDVSTIFIGGRFIVGFGGWNDEDNMNELWIFDLRNLRGSSVKKEGEETRRTYWPILVTRGQVLYMIGDWGASDAFSISFATLARLIQLGSMRSAFCLYLKVPLPPSEELKRQCLQKYISHWL